MSIICLGLAVVVLGVRVERIWLAHVVKVRSSVLPVFVCVCVCVFVRPCACGHGHSTVTVVCVWTGCSESPGGILGISDSRKSGHTLNLSLQHNPHNERIQAPLHTLSCLACAPAALCA